MFFLRRFKFVFFFMLLAFATEGFSQKTLSRLIVGSGGAFSNPNDFVTVSAYSPTSQTSTFIGEIKTQAIQDVLVDSVGIYVSATDSIVLFDAVTFEKKASTAVSGVRYLLVVNDLLFVSIQYPETSNFVKVFNKHTLELQSVVTQITGEAAGMLRVENQVYVAVPGDWTSTEGKMAILNASDGAFVEEVDFSTAGVGIHDLFLYQNKVLTVQRSAWGSTSGMIMLFNPLDKTLQQYPLALNVGKGIGIHDDLLYVQLNNALGTINLSNFEVENPALVPDPGSASYISFGDVVLDPIGEKLYASTTDYFSMGAGFIYDLNGNATGTFEAGISTEALALEYGYYTGLNKDLLPHITFSPHPVKDVLNLRLPVEIDAVRLEMVGSNGLLVLSHQLKGTLSQQLNVGELPSGLYLLRLVAGNGKVMAQSKMIKL
jgi:hypothetical protein